MSLVQTLHTAPFSFKGQKNMTKFKGLEPSSHRGASMSEEVLRLKGKSAEAFLKYDSRKLSKKERSENKKAHQYYLKHHKTAMN